MAPRKLTSSNDRQYDVGELSALQLKALKLNILTEHFAFAPESFAKNGMDVANTAMYAATELAEQKLLGFRGIPTSSDSKEPVTLNEGEVQKGLYRLETLLESAIDKHFDLFEIYVLRNTFTLPDDSIPYITLSHHQNIDSNLRGQDVASLAEYEDEVQLYEKELEKQRQLSCIREVLLQKDEIVQKQAQEVGYMRGAGRLSDTTQSLVPQLSLLQRRLEALLDVPVPPLRRIDGNQGEPWRASRSSFVNWAASSKVDALAVTKKKIRGESQSEDAKMANLKAKMGQTGDNDDAQKLFTTLRVGNE